MKQLLIYILSVVLAFLLIIYFPKIYAYGVLACLVLVFLISWLPRRFQEQDQRVGHSYKQLSMVFLLVMAGYLTAGLVKLFIR